MGRHLAVGANSFAPNRQIGDGANKFGANEFAPTMLRDIHVELVDQPTPGLVGWARPPTVVGDRRTHRAGFAHPTSDGVELGQAPSVGISFRSSRCVVL